MGATTFIVQGRGATAQEAFSSLVSAAQHQHGHGGYTGTIAEKRSFKMVTPPKDVEAERYANHLIDEALDYDIDDKWGPAGCIKVAEGEWLFFGWASE